MRLPYFYAIPFFIPEYFSFSVLNRYNRFGQRVLLNRGRWDRIHCFDLNIIGGVAFTRGPSGLSSRIHSVTFLPVKLKIIMSLRLTAF